MLQFDETLFALTDWQFGAPLSKPWLAAILEFGCGLIPKSADVQNLSVRQRLPAFSRFGACFLEDRLVFADFMSSSGDRFYAEVESLGAMKTVMEGFLDDYNNMFAVPMPLVMFADACEHVARVCRVLRQPSGNALLLGVGGSGRQSLSRLASFMSEYEIFQIDVVKGYGMTEFKDDLKTCLMKCGSEQKQTTFLFADTQIVNEQMVEAINNVLNSGDVPNLYKNEACRVRVSE